MADVDSNRIAPQAGGIGSLIDLDDRETREDGSGSILHLREVIQAGDVFLLVFDCPMCGADCLTDFRSADCRECNADFTDIPITAPTRKQLRLLAGTFRKCKAGLTKKKIRLILQQQGQECAYCGTQLGSEFHVEHIVPLGFGGTNNLSNICIACPPCNLTAGGLVFQDFYQKQQHIIMKRFKKRIVQ